MQKRIGWALAATMALTGVSASYAPASAAMPVAPAVSTAVQSGGQIEQVRERGDRRWRRGGYYRGDRHYRHHRRNRGFSPGLAFGLGLGIGSGFGYYGNSYYGNSYYGNSYYAPRYYAPAPRYTYRARGGWKEACAARYRSFDWNSGTYLGYDGRRHRCRL